MNQKGMLVYGGLIRPSLTEVLNSFLCAVIEFDHFWRKPARHDPVEKDKGFVLKSGNGDHFAVSKCAVTMMRDGFGGHFRGFELADFLSARNASEISFSRTGT